MRICRCVANSNCAMATAIAFPVTIRPRLPHPHSSWSSLQHTPFRAPLTPTCYDAFAIVKQTDFPSPWNLKTRLGRPFLAPRDSGALAEHTRGLRNATSPQRKRGSISVSKKNATHTSKFSQPKAINPSGKDAKMSDQRVRAKNKNTPIVVEQEIESDDDEFEDDEEYDESLEEDDEEFDDDLQSETESELAVIDCEESDSDFSEMGNEEDAGADFVLLESDETDSDAFIDDMLEEEGEGVDDIQLGDGRDGGGVNLGQTPWGEKALMIAKEVLLEFGSNFSLYAFKSSPEGCIYVRLDKFSDKYGSPTMVEIESFSSIYGKRLEDAGQKGILPSNLALEVSSPGAERAVEVPDQLERFKDLPMLVRYVEETNATNPEAVKDCILTLESFEVDSNKSVWKLANVKANRELAGKGRRVLTRKQKEWRAELPLSSLRLVRLYMDI